MGDYRELKVWRRARTLTKSVYEATDGFPSNELYGLTSQTRRASVSIGANLAEGFGRTSDRDTARFIDYAIGSSNEVEQHVVLADDLGYLDKEQRDRLLDSIEEIRRMLYGLLKTVRNQNRP